MVNEEMGVRIVSLETQHKLTEQSTSSQNTDGWKARLKNSEVNQIELLIKDLYGTMDKSIEEMKLLVKEKISEKMEKNIGKNELIGTQCIEANSDENFEPNISTAKQIDDKMYKQNYTKETTCAPSGSSIALDEEKGRRCKNAIIYGLKEKEIESEDQQSVLGLLQAIHTQCKPLKIYRLGRREPNKHRPIKLIFSEKKEKYDIVDKFKSK